MSHPDYVDLLHLRLVSPAQHSLTTELLVRIERVGTIHNPISTRTATSRRTLKQEHGIGKSQNARKQHRESRCTVSKKCKNMRAQSHVPYTSARKKKLFATCKPSHGINTYTDYRLYLLSVEKRDPLCSGGMYARHISIYHTVPLSIEAPRDEMRRTQLSDPLGHDWGGGACSVHVATCTSPEQVHTSYLLAYGFVCARLLRLPTLLTYSQWPQSAAPRIAPVEGERRAVRSDSSVGAGIGPGTGQGRGPRPRPRY